MMPHRRLTNNRWAHAETSPIHGWGLFARVNIPEGTDIVEYDGPRVTTDEGRRMAEEGNVYILIDTMSATFPTEGKEI